MEYKELAQSDNKMKRKNQSDDSYYSDYSDNEEKAATEEEKLEFEATLTENVNLIKSEDLSAIANGVVNVNECLKVHPEYIISIFNEDIIVPQILTFFLDNVDPNITPIVLGLFRLYCDESEPGSIDTDCILMKIGLVTFLCNRLEESIPYAFAIDILETLNTILCQFPGICTSYMSSGLMSRIMDILFNYVIDRPPSRPEDQDKHAKKVEFIDDSIDITDNDDKVVSACLKLITSELLVNNEMTSYTTKECLDYIILFIFSSSYPQASYVANVSLNSILSHRKTYAYGILPMELIKCDKLGALLEMAFAGNENCWYSICDLFHMDELKKEMCDKGSIEMIKQVLVKSHEIVEESHDEESKEDLIKAEKMRLLALSALNAATGEDYRTIFEQIIGSEMLPLIVECIVEAPIKAKREACCVFSNLATKNVIGEMLTAFPDFPLQLLQALNSLPNEEKVTVLITIGDVIDFAIKSGEFDPLECIGGEEGHEIIEELLDTVDLNVYDAVVRINDLIVSCLDEED